jgi:hypothetical protein
MPFGRGIGAFELKVMTGCGWREHLLGISDGEVALARFSAGSEKCAVGRDAFLLASIA